MIVERIVPDELESNERALIEHLERYELAAFFLRFNDEVVDAACGVGYGSAMLAKKCKCVYGFDISEEAISYAVKQYQSANLKFSVKDLDQESLPECDVFVSFETVEHLKYPEEFLEKVKSKTRRLILISTPIVPTKNVNPFHLHDFNKEQIEKLLAPWQPVYFCIQSGSGGEIYGIWIFKRELDGEEEHRFLFQNLKDQQKQFMYHHKLLEQQKVWSIELENGKAWLEDQWKKWQNEATQREKRIAELQSWIAQLEKDKSWLEREKSIWKARAESQAAQVAELKTWISELENGKAWLEGQWRDCQELVKKNQKDMNDLITERDQKITELENWIKELEHGKKWLEEQYNLWQEEAKLHADRIAELEKSIVEIEKGKAWLEGQWRDCQQIMEKYQKYIKNLESRRLFRILVCFGILPRQLIAREGR